MNQLEAATGLERDSIVETVKEELVDAAVFTGLELTTEHLEWRADELAAGDSMRLSLAWDEGQSIPFSLRVAPQGYLRGTGELVMLPSSWPH